MKLSKAQQACLDKMEIGKMYSSYHLKVSLATLDSLVKKGLLDSHTSRLGSLYAPQNGRYYWKIELENNDETASILMNMGMLVKK